MNTFHEVEQILQHRRAQFESVKGKLTPFRVEFRYACDTSHYQYFETYEDCLRAEDAICLSSHWGHSIIIRPKSQVIQVKGPRGGWSKK